MKKILDYKYTITCSSLSILIVTLLILSWFVMINIFTVQQIVEYSNYIPVNVTIVHIKNSTFETPNQKFIIFKFHFYYNNTLQDTAVLCDNIDCITNYNTYKINNNVILYLFKEKFQFYSNIGVLVIW